MNMKTLLNLLPEGKKELVQSRLRSRFLLWQLFLFFLLEIFYLTILVSIFLILDFQLQGLQKIAEDSVRSSQGEERQLDAYEKKFAETNKAVDLIGSVDRSHLYFSQVFVLLDMLLPSGVTVSSLSTKDYTVSLSGRAEKREDLLLLEDKMKKAEECISSVNIPLSNLFSQEKIDFQMDFTVTPECLRKDSL